MAVGGEVKEMGSQAPGGPSMCTLKSPVGRKGLGRRETDCGPGTEPSLEGGLSGVVNKPMTGSVWACKAERHEDHSVLFGGTRTVNAEDSAPPPARSTQIVTINSERRDLTWVGPGGLGRAVCTKRLLSRGFES